MVELGLNFVPSSQKAAPSLSLNHFFTRGITKRGYWLIILVESIAFKSFYSKAKGL